MARDISSCGLLVLLLTLCMEKTGRLVCSKRENSKFPSFDREIGMASKNSNYIGCHSGQK